jgi:glycosyltransferase involved in cell wall biosynthesis
MKLALIGPGSTPIPPKGWGAVESLIWDYYLNLKSACCVDIINEPTQDKIINACNAKNYDVIHIMYDDHIIIAPHLKCKKIFYTSHFAYITHPTFEQSYSSYFNSIFAPAIHLNSLITLNALSEDIKNVYISHGFPPHKINVLNNGAREDKFSYSPHPHKPYKTAYIAKVEKRKRQYIYQGIPHIDFIGNYQDSSFDRNATNYLGEWTKDTLYKKLTHYCNLALLSDGEADPLVVKEALMAGLGVVVSECASAHLNAGLPFIDIIPNASLENVNFVNETISDNRAKSAENRNQIREYALKKFSWENIIKKYLKILKS